MTGAGRGELTVYYDFASSFCYIARAIVQRLVESRGVSVTWLPFEVIDYLPPKGAMPQNPAFVRRGEAARAQRLAEHYGLTLHARERLLNSNLALCAVEHVREATGDAGPVDRIHGALFDAFYRDQRDIGSLATILDIAVEMGLLDGLEAALRSERFKERVAQSRVDAHAKGIVAVPTWLSHDYGIVGIVEYPEYERLLAIAERGSPVGAASTL
ncbi:MAG TPA: DsbA family protein [Chloroflexota bacterium]|nr:DsbA family protein [Chloroflexota bacterium]